VATAESGDAWEPFLLNLYHRGLKGQGTTLFMHDGSDGLENAIHSIYGSVSRTKHRRPWPTASPHPYCTFRLTRSRRD